MTGTGSTGEALFAPYLPRVAIDWLKNPEQRWRTVDASLLFVDVSGFTALSERLARRGPEGAEEISSLIDTCFAALLADAYSEDGSLLKFGGDALLLYFDGAEHPKRAAAAATAMRRSLRRVGQLKTSMGNVRLRTSAGIHSGEMHLFLVGDSHRELIVTGPLASRTLQMEKSANGGEIVISPETAALIDGSLIGNPRDEGYLLRDRASSGGRRYPIVPAGEVNLSSAVSTEIRNHLLSGELDSEHRYVAIAFVRFQGVYELLQRAGVDRAAESLGHLVAAVQEEADMHGVTFLGSDIDHDGGKIVLVAGAPQARDDDSGRMLAVLRRIADLDLPLQVRLGAHRGYVFAGDIGPAYRRTYTVMGDAVNLTARLMAASGPGEVLVTEEILADARFAYDATPCQPFRAKGKGELVRGFALGARSAEQGDRFHRPGDSPLVGRDGEMELLLSCFGRTEEGSGLVVEVAGPAGIGKSRLIAEMLEQVAGCRVVSSSSEPYEATTPWATFRRFLKAALGIEPAAQVQVDELRSLVAKSAPELLGSLPLIGTVMGLELEPTPETAALEPRFALQRTREALVGLLGGLASDRAVFVFEDLQWCDESSSLAISEVEAAALSRPWLLIKTRRLDVPRSSSDDQTNLFLPPISDAAALALVRAATADAPFHPHRRQALVDRAGGNPLFLEELLRGGFGADAEEDLPDSLNGVVISMLDRVVPRYRRLLQYAAVVGTEFSLDLVEQLAGEELPRAEVRRSWGDLVTRRGPLLRFRNRIVRDAAYQSLSFRKRRELHSRAAEAIESAASSPEEAPAELLSLHYLNARRFDECWRWAVVAGERAKERFANVEAARLYDRAVQAARQIPDLEPQSVGEVWEAQANAWHRAGEYERAEEAYRQARRFRASDPVALAQLHLWGARIADLQGRPTTAVRRLKKGLRQVEGGAGPARSVQADLEVMYGWISQRRGHYSAARLWAERALESAGRSANSHAAAEANLLIDWSSLHLGEPAVGENAAKALAVFQQEDDPSRVAFTLNLMGALAYFRGSWAEATDLYRRALETYERAGNEADAAQARYNAAEILLDQGCLVEAEEMLEEIATVYRAVGYRPGLALVYRDLARIATRTGDFLRARGLLAEAREILAGFGATGRVLEVDMWSAELTLREGRAEEALVLIRMVAAKLDSEGSATMGPAVQWILGSTLAELGRVSQAEEALAAGLADARARGALYDVVRTLDALKSLVGRGGTSWTDRMESERRELVERLGLAIAPTSVGAIGQFR